MAGVDARCLEALASELEALQGPATYAGLSSILQDPPSPYHMTTFICVIMTTASICLTMTTAMFDDAYSHDVEALTIC